MTAQEFKIRFLPLKDKLYRFAMRLLNNREEAEDTVQEVFLKVWEMGEGFKKYNNSEAVLMTMIRNRSLDKIRTKKNKAAELTDQMQGVHYEDPLKGIENSESVQLVQLLMKKLPEQQKTILHLRDVEGMSFEEISQITGFDGNYIRVNLSRARKKIKESLQKAENYEFKR